MALIGGGTDAESTTLQPSTGDAVRDARNARERERRRQRTSSAVQTPEHPIRWTRHNFFSPSKPLLSFEFFVGRQLQ
jgi:hypothetical protein